MAYCQEELVERAHWNLLVNVMKEEWPEGSADLETDKFTIPSSSLPKDSDQQRLCQKCQDITMNVLNTRAGYRHHDLEDLMRSAKHCSACVLIQETIRTAATWHTSKNSMIESPRDAMDEFARLMAKQGLFVAKPTRIFLTFEKSDQTHGLGFVCISTPLYSTTTPPEVQLRGQYLGRLLLHNDSDDSPQPIRSRGSEHDVLDRLATWLSHREAEILTSSPKTEEAPLPTRVLDLGGCKSIDAGNLETDIRLMETAGQCGRYATLSYSWGGYKESRTLKSNYQDRKNGISFNSLPPVFQQAVKVTRGLGIRYLWIDALCIIQEDREDWSQEASRMSEVYWMSAVRLAVTDSKNPTQPFFPPNEFVSVKMPHLQLEEPSMNLDFFSMVPKQLVPQTEEELVALRQTFKDFLFIVRNSFSVMMDDDVEADGNSFGLPKRRMVEEPKHNATQRSAGNLITRREGHVLRKLAQPSASRSKEACYNPLDNQSTVTDDRSDGKDIYESAPLQGEEHEYFDEGSQMDNEDTMIAEFLQKTINWDADMLEKATKPRIQNGATDRPKTTYLSMPRFYVADVDDGYLNSRGWVLQERLLAPRTIHFTKCHIYCEDNDDICGEDWVRRFYTWASCIRKESSHAQVNLFPERSHVRQREFPDRRNHTFKSWARAKCYRPESQMIRRPWHNISQIFNRCQLSFDSDRLAAISGLVHRKRADPKSAHVDGRNFCGLWEKTLYLDLAWYCEAEEGTPSRRIFDLGLPSWSWLSYTGRIGFIRDARSTLDHGTELTRTIGALELVDAQVPEFSELLPLSVPASLTFRVALRQIYGFSTKITKYGTHAQSRQDLAKASPFDFDPRTSTIPIALSSLTECQEIFNENRRLVGFVAFDEGIYLTGDLFCAHISTLTDEALDAAKRDLAKPGVDSVDMREYQRPILAYALVLAKLKDEEDSYARVGFAQVNYYWMTSAHKVNVKII